jgi:hypothetical protein
MLTSDLLEGDPVVALRAKKTPHFPPAANGRILQTATAIAARPIAFSEQRQISSLGRGGPPSRRPLRALFDFLDHRARARIDQHHAVAGI